MTKLLRARLGAPWRPYVRHALQAAAVAATTVAAGERAVSCRWQWSTAHQAAWPRSPTSPAGGRRRRGGGDVNILKRQRDNAYLTRGQLLSSSRLQAMPASSQQGHVQLQHCVRDARLSEHPSCNSRGPLCTTPTPSCEALSSPSGLAQAHLARPFALVHPLPRPVVARHRLLERLAQQAPSAQHHNAQRAQRRTTYMIIFYHLYPIITHMYSAVAEHGKRRATSLELLRCYLP